MKSKKLELGQFFEGLISAMWDVRIAVNTLNRKFGIEAISVDSVRLNIQLYNGIDDLAHALGVEWDNLNPKRGFEWKTTPLVRAISRDLL